MFDHTLIPGTSPRPADPWLCRLDTFIRVEIANPDLDNELLAARMRTSARSLHRRLKVRSGEAPARYVRRHRMAYAAHLLQSGTYYTVKETATAVGYHSVSYFIEQYTTVHGNTPLTALRSAGYR